MEITIPIIGKTFNKQPEQDTHMFPPFEEQDMGEDEHYLEEEYTQKLTMEKNRKEGPFWKMVQTQVDAEVESIKTRDKRARDNMMVLQKSKYARFRVSQEKENIKSRKRIEIQILEENEE